MAWLRIDVTHQEILDFLMSSPRVASVSGRASTGPFTEQRQVVTYAACVGYAADRRHKVGSSKIAIRDSIMVGAHGAAELGFALAFQANEWDLSVVADGDDASETRLRVLEEYAAGGFSLIEEQYALAGRSISAAELMLLVKKSVGAPKAKYHSSEAEKVENPLIAALRRRGKIRDV